MLNSELFSAAFAGHGFVAVVCDNDGYAVIASTPDGQGGDGVQQPVRRLRRARGTADGVRVDFAAHAAALGCAVVDCRPAARWPSCARPTGRPRPGPASSTGRPSWCAGCDPSEWTESGAWWEVGVGEQLSGRADYDQAKAGQLRWPALSQPRRPELRRRRPGRGSAWRYRSIRWPTPRPGRPGPRPARVEPVGVFIFKCGQLGLHAGLMCHANQ